MANLMVAGIWVLPLSPRGGNRMYGLLAALSGIISVLRDHQALALLLGELEHPDRRRFGRISIGRRHIAEQLAG